jgi:hypothetical protein
MVGESMTPASEPTYWIDVFTPETWREALAAGGTVSGFPYRRRNTVAEIRVGDVLLCYVAGISRWIGALEVTGEHYSDSTPIWTGGSYSERVKVNPLIRLEFETAVPIVEIKPDMQMFDSLANPAQWSIFFRSSPGRINQDDAQVVLAALQEAERSQTRRPIPASKLSAGPKVVHDVDEGDVESAAVGADDGDAESEEAEVTSGNEHTEIQWRLLKLGSDMGLKVWAPKPDRGHIWSGHRPGEVVGMLEELPLQFDVNTMRTIRNIDVLWLQRQGHSIISAFEIEASTSIYSGLLRMSDLIAMQPNLSIPLYIVAPDSRREHVFREISRPTFDRREHPLSEYCQYISFSSLREGYEKVIGLAKSLKSSYIETLAEAYEVVEG